jgi:hypothetical protein
MSGGTWIRGRRVERQKLLHTEDSATSYLFPATVISAEITILSFCYVRSFKNVNSEKKIRDDKLIRNVIRCERLGLRRR